MRQARYLAVGGACALLNNILVIAFAHAGAGYATASVLAFGPLLVFGYALATIVMGYSRRSFLTVSKSAWSGGLARFRTKRAPVRVKKTRQNRNSSDGR